MGSSPGNIELARAHRQAGRWGEAESLCRAMLDADPAQGAVLDYVSEWAQEERDPQKAAALYFVVGHARQRAVHLEQAADSYSLAVARFPAHAHAWANRGIVLRLLNRLDEARASFLRAIEAAPHVPGFYFNLGNLLRDSGETRQAVDYYRRALEKLESGGTVSDPALYVSVANNLGMASMSGYGDFAKAEFFFRTALGFDADNADVLTNLGACLCHQGKFEAGIVCYRRALEKKPDDKATLNNLCSALRAVGKMDEALALYPRLVALHPDFAEARTNYAMALLNAGRFDEGWPEHEWRHRMPQHQPPMIFSRPLWLGEPIAGQKLLIHAEQGQGDSIQFCRYATLASGQGIEVILQVPASLKRLLSSLKGVSQIIAMDDELPVFDWHCPMMSLPHAFHTRPETIPADIPYLSVGKRALAEWAYLVPAIPGRKKVGLVWAGNPRRTVYDHAALDRRRSVPVEMLAPLIAVPGLGFYSLQKDGPAAPKAFGLSDLMSRCEDFADTAALIMQLDLVITVDTSIVHLAGALGKPVWMIDRIDCCWRWLQGREDSPWYPTLRIFRQERSGDWRPVIERVAQKLALWARGEVC